MPFLCGLGKMKEGGSLGLISILYSPPGHLRLPLAVWGKQQEGPRPLSGAHETISKVPSHDLIFIAVCLHCQPPPPIFQMRKPARERGSGLSEGHTVNKWQGCDPRRSCLCCSCHFDGKSHKCVSYLSKTSTKPLSGYDPAFPECVHTGLPSKFKCWW